MEDETDGDGDDDADDDEVMKARRGETITYLYR